MPSSHRFGTCERRHGRSFTVTSSSCFRCRVRTTIPAARSGKSVPIVVSSTNLTTSGEPSASRSKRSQCLVDVATLDVDLDLDALHRSSHLHRDLTPNEDDQSFATVRWVRLSGPRFPARCENGTGVTGQQVDRPSPASALNFEPNDDVRPDATPRSTACRYCARQPMISTRCARVELGGGVLSRWSDAEYRSPGDPSRGGSWNWNSSSPMKPR